MLTATNRQDNNPPPGRQSTAEHGVPFFFVLSCTTRAPPPPQVEANIEVLWQEQLTKNPLLFNGSKFRLAGFSTEGDRKSSATATATATANVAAGGAVSDTTEDSSDGGRGSGRNTPPPRPPPPPPTNAARRGQSRSPTSSPPTRKLRLRLGLTDYRTFRGESLCLAIVDWMARFPSMKCLSLPPSLSLFVCLPLLGQPYFFSVFPHKRLPLDFYKSRTDSPPASRAK